MACTLNDIEFDPRTVTVVDEGVWIEGIAPDGREVSAGFVLNNTNFADIDTDPEFFEDGVALRAFFSFRWLYDVESGDYIEIVE